MKDLKEDILLILGIALVVIISSLVGYIVGKYAPLDEIYKVYYENSVTYIERVK